MNTMTPPQLNELELLSFEYQNYIQNIRRDLHQIPELAWEEEKTISYLIEKITSILSSNKNSNIQLTLSVFPGGISVDVLKDKNVPMFLFRADVDALPIQEETGYDFSSIHPGKMHACGHDCHSAMLLGFLKIVSDNKFTPSVNLRLVWQRAEERSDIVSGAQSLIKEGVLNDVDEVYALHINSLLDHGLFFSKPGDYFSNSAYINIVVDCIGGHLTNPHQGQSSIEIATDIHLTLRGVDKKLLSPLDPVVFFPTISTAGSARNILPNKALLTYSLRNFLTQTKREDFLKAIRLKVEHIASHQNGEISSFIFDSGYPILRNDVSSYIKTKKALNSFGFETMEDNLNFSGEDFSFMLINKPGCYWHMGARSKNPYNHHTAKFNPDDSILYKGTAFWMVLSSNLSI